MAGVVRHKVGEADAFAISEAGVAAVPEGGAVFAAGCDDELREDRGFSEVSAGVADSTLCSRCRYDQRAGTRQRVVCCMLPRISWDSVHMGRNVLYILGSGRPPMEKWPDIVLLP